MSVSVKLPAFFVVATLVLSAAPAIQCEETSASIATVRVTDRNGNPMRGARVFVTVQTDAREPKRLVDGKLTGDGTIDIPAPDAKLDVRGFIVNVGKRTFEVGRFTLDDLETSHQFKFLMPPDEGDEAPDIVLADLFTGETQPLSAFRGQVVFLDFWASWCGPCQKPMEHNQDVMTRRAADWDGKATIIALSIDAEKEDALNHVEAKGWMAIPLYWDAGWQSESPRAYGVEAIPRGFLIDKNGVIQWRGNPRSIDPEELIDGLLSADPN